MASTYDEEKKIVTLKNFFSECYKFNNRSFSPFVVSIDFCLLYMIQSKQYCLTPDFISCYRKIDLNEANIMWNILHEPDAADVQMVRALVFDPRSYDARKVTFTPSFVASLSVVDSTVLCSWTSQPNPRAGKWK